MFLIWLLGEDWTIGFDYVGVFMLFCFVCFLFCLLPKIFKIFITREM